MGKFYANPLESADLTTTNVAQLINNVDERYLEIKAIRLWLIFYNNPVFTDLNVKIYDYNAGTPGSLLFTSKSVAKASIVTSDNGVKGVTFEFDPPAYIPAIILPSGLIRRYVVLNGTGYTGTENSHIGWLKSWPENWPYSQTPPQNGFNLADSALNLTLIGGEFKGKI